MKILILGGTGNISTDAVSLLIERGHDLTLVTRGTKPVPEGCAHIKADIRNRDEYAAALKDYRGDAAIQFVGFLPEHCQADRDVLRGKVGQYLFISSCVVYQRPTPRVPLTEDIPHHNPYWNYAIGKIACEAYLNGVRGGDFPVTIVRPAHTFGKAWIPSPLNGSDWTVSARVLAGKPIVVHGDGQSLWTMTATSDFAVGLAGLVGNEKAYGEDFHITSDQALTWNCIYYELGLALGRQPEIVHIPVGFLVTKLPRGEDKLNGDKAQNAVFDNTKIKRFVPEFECKKTFRTAIRESVAWYQEDPARRTVNEQQDRNIDAWIKEWRELC